MSSNMNNIIISLAVCSNRPEQIVGFIDAYETCADDPPSVEVLVNIDKGDSVMAGVLEAEKKKRTINVRYIDTFEGGFYNSWKFYNDLLKIADPNSYFKGMFSDEMLVKTKGWDTQLKKLIGYFPDDIFRVRASQYRYRNYQDLWECGFAPDSICFYTHRWLEICGTWADCFSTDAFQQCVAYHLFSSDPYLKEQDNRDIPIAHLQFAGEGTNIGLPAAKMRKRVQGGMKAWFVLMSHKMQERAALYGLLLKCNIISAGNDNYEARIDDKDKKVKVFDKENNVVVDSFSYRKSKIWHWYTSLVRSPYYLYYTGGGEPEMQKGFLWNFTYYLSTRYDSMEKLFDSYNHYSDKFKEWLEKRKNRKGTV